MNNNCVKFVIWQTLRKLPKEEEAERTVKLEGDNNADVDTCLLTHDWKIHLDVIEGDPRPIIARIEADFGPSFLRRRFFVSNRPCKKKNAIIDGSNDNTPASVWRCFESRQKCGGAVPIRFSIIGMGGTILRVKSDSRLETVEGYFIEKNLSTFAVPNEQSPLQPIPLPINRPFSVQQVSDPLFGPDSVGSENNMPRSIRILPRKRNLSWERGEEGVKSIRQSMVESINQNAPAGDCDMITTIISIRLSEDIPNKKDLENITRLTQNFIKYEDAIDKIIQINRESAFVGVPLPSSHNPIRSNKRDVNGDTNRARHDTLGSSSSTIVDLVKSINPRENQLYKLTFESEEQTGACVARFFLHAVPDDVDLTVTLLRFYTLFVHNSFRFQNPRPLKPTRSIEDEMEFLFSAVVKDRFVEEMLLLRRGQHDGVMSLCSFTDFDIDLMMGDDEISISLSSMHDRVEKDPFSNSSESGHGHPPNRKRLRPLSPQNSNATIQQHDALGFFDLDADIVFDSHLCLSNKYYTASKLATIGKKLSTGTSSSKTERMERLKGYFDARNDELNKFFETEKHHFDSAILGVEFLFKNDPSRDDNSICVILKGGKQMTAPRRSVCESKYGKKEFHIKILQVSETKAKAIFESLYPKETNVQTFNDCISGIDDFIDGLQKDQNEMKCSPCRFALVHDLFL